MTATLAQPRTASLDPASAPRLSFGGVVRSEWIKALSLRSIRWSMIVSVVLGIAMSVAMAFAIRALLSDQMPGGYAEYVTTVTSFPSSLLALVFGVLGVFVFSSEYASGMILSTLTAAPRRGLVIAAKAVVLTLISVVAAAVVLLASVAVAVVVLPEAAGSVLTTQVLTSLLGTVVFLLTVALFAFAVAGIVRSTAGGITIVVGLIFLLPMVLQIVTQVADWSWAQLAMNYLPTTLGSVVGMGLVDGMAGMESTVRMPGYGEAMAVLALWGILPLLVATRLFLSRDAR
ncbi:MAG TPA: ABC transporter permease [Arachnia sp.]|nr:ABC transporter permease [Arachnia sp.]HMT86861.1 ABC transporter permease [Arachnia sp.]